MIRTHHHLVDDLAVGEGGHGGEGQSIRNIAQTELPIVVPPLN